jgi:lipid A ethanolaminephosphotransferase
MFSLSDRSDFNVDDARHTENVLDVLIHAGVHILWRDNNSDSKGVAEKVPFEDWRSPDINPVCDIECRDVGMLTGLPAYIDAQHGGDIVIVLHQMGTHGPAYYKRYPEAFEKFTPVCKTNQLENCTDAEIGNAYDNAILYTDYFLSQVIALLKAYDGKFETAMYYMSDHGESLGENGLYLHGLPYMLAPETQKHVASIMWFGASYEVNRQATIAKANDEISHDHYFHTVLSLMEIQTDVYDPGKSIIVHVAKE